MSIRSALRELSHKEASLDEIEEFQRQVDDEKNDLGACILMATNASWTGTKTRGRLVSEEGRGARSHKKFSSAEPFASIGRTLTTIWNT
jgi:hypothetical protein